MTTKYETNKFNHACGVYIGISDGDTLELLLRFFFFCIISLSSCLDPSLTYNHQRFVSNDALLNGNKRKAHPPVAVSGYAYSHTIVTLVQEPFFRVSLGVCVPLWWKKSQAKNLPTLLFARVLLKNENSFGEIYLLYTVN